MKTKPTARVRISIQGNRIPMYRRSGLFLQAFGIKDREIPEIYEYAKWNIVCRLEQFAMFLILRNEYGQANTFMELAPTLLNPPPAPSARELNVCKR